MKRLLNVVVGTSLGFLAAAYAGEKEEDGWTELFNGRDLTGWTPKIRGFASGVNAGNTFFVKDGLLCCGYGDALYAEGFRERFGHLFHDVPFSNYVLRATYRMDGAQAKGGPGWANRNNGIMLHAQRPETMAVDQDFPVSVEFQLLSGLDDGKPRPTANLCTPGTNVERDGRLYTPHTLNSVSATHAADEWTTVEAEVRGGDEMAFRVLENGVFREVLRFQRPQYDPKAGCVLPPEAVAPLVRVNGGDLVMRGGTIAIQSESAPTQYRSIRIRPLEAKPASAVAVQASAAAQGAFKNGTAFAFKDIPAELAVRRRVGEPVRFALEENATTGYRWDVEWNASECDVSLDHRPSADRLCGAAGTLDVSVTSKIYTPARVEFAYRRPWEKGVKPVRTLKLIVYTVGEAKSPLYPANAVNRLLKEECAKRGIEIVDWHLHIRGGMTPAMACERERASGIRSSAMENHGREWEIYDNAKLRAFAARSRQANPKMPVGIQVNDRDWFEQIDAATRAKFDYILADTMIMGKLPSGRDNRLWMVKEVADPDRWMSDYFAHTMRILGEPISILANPTYLPEPLAAAYDRLWTEGRMRAVIAKAVERGIALELQAGSPYPRPKFLKLAKEMGAKFSFGTNNFDPTPKDLSRWLEAIVWLDLRAEDIWSPNCLKDPGKRQ